MKKYLMIISVLIMFIACGDKTKNPPEEEGCKRLPGQDCPVK